MSAKFYAKEVTERVFQQWALFIKELIRTLYVEAATQLRCLGHTKTNQLANQRKPNAMHYYSYLSRCLNLNKLLVNLVGF